MTDNIETETHEDTLIHKFDIDESYKEQALEQIKKMVSGNGIQPDEVELKEFEGEMLEFQAENVLTLLTKITNKKIAGRVTGPIAVDNPIAAKEEINKAYLTLSQDVNMDRQIKDMLLKRDDQGFALHDNIIPIPFWKKEFVVFEPCHACKTTGSVKCQPCAGKGLERCPRCNGVGFGSCSHCNGGQTITSPSGQQVQCPNCSGEGRTSCTLCSQNGTIQCSTCRSKGVTKCPSCNGNAWNSDIHIVEIEARTAFDYPRDRLPEKVVEIIEKHGAKLSQHADIKVSQLMEGAINIDDEEKAQVLEDAHKNKNHRINIVYEVLLPYAHIEYDINGVSYYTFLFGKNGKLIHVSPFLDDLVKNGIRKLHDAAEMRGNVGENLKQAAQYRTVKEAIIYTAANPLKKARIELKKANRIGLSNGAITDMVSSVDLALKNITNKPRNVGLAVSGVIYIALFSIYFLSPIRNIITSGIANQGIHIVLDMLVLIISIYIGILTIQTIANSAIKKVIHSIGASISTIPKLGRKLYWNAGIAIIIFGAMMEISRSLDLNPPMWYASLFS